MKAPSFVLFAVLIVAFLPLASALDNCADVFRVSYASSALIPIRGEDISPGVAVVIVKSLKEDPPFWFSKGPADFFYIAAADQVSRDTGEKIATAGEVFYKNSTEVDYFSRAGSEKPLYVANGDNLAAAFEPAFEFEYAGKTYLASAVLVSSSKTASFSSVNSVGSRFFVLTKALDPQVAELARGSVFIETSEGGSVYVKGGLVYYIGSCAVSCSDPDFEDYYQASSCSSALVKGDDYCLGASKLGEFVCSPKTTACEVQAFDCPFGCENGKCKTGVKGTCSDTDEMDVLSAGSVSGVYTNGSTYYQRDSCASASQVNEFYCDAGTAKTNVVSCPPSQACSNGACVPAGEVSSACSDSDGGKNYEISGTCSDSSGSYADSCTANGVKEYSCNANACESVESTCSSCSDGKCGKESLLGPDSGTTTLFAIVVAIALGAGLLVMKPWAPKKK